MKTFRAVLVSSFIFSLHSVVAQTYDAGSTTYNISGYVEDFGSTGVRVGDTTSDNTLVISKQGTLKNGSAYVGRLAAASGNKVTVVEPGSGWYNSGILYIGYWGSSNSVEVLTGAVVTNGTCYMGYYDSAGGNRFLVDGGSVWSNTTVMVGRLGDGNTLSILGGSQVYSSEFISCGREPQASGNSILVSGSGTLWDSSGNIQVGADGDNNTMVISNGASVVANAGFVGANAVASGNSVTVTGNGSEWDVALTLKVGSSGDNNSMVVSDGGHVESITGYIGAQTDSSGNSVTISGSNSIWQVTGGGASHLYVGDYGRTGSLTIESGGEVRNINGYVGRYATADSTSVLVSGAGSLWYSSETMILGNGSTNNELRIEAGGYVHDRSGSVGGYAASTGNEVYVTGMGSVWSNSYEMTHGFYGSQNLLAVESGGHVHTRYGYIGRFASANSNLVNVTGSGSGLHATQSLLVGSDEGNEGNRLSISGGGAVETPLLTVESNNIVSLESGGTLEISGSFDGDPDGDFIFSGGKLIVHGTLSNLSSVGSGCTLETPAVVGDLDLYGTYIPGLSIADSSVQGAFSMDSGAVVEMELDGYLPGVGHDRLILSGASSLKGTLTLELGFGFSPTNWSSFQLFDWGEAPSGQFDKYRFPTVTDKRWDVSRLYDLGVVRLLPGDSGDDGDGDGIADVWEFDCFGGDADPDGNPDGDLFSNLDEYIAGTDPTNALSFFEITNWGQDTNEGFFIEWTSVTGRYYDVRWSDALSNGFTLLESEIEHPRNSSTASVENAAFFQVEVRLK